MIETPVYLDYNATTPCDPRVLEAMLPYFTKNFGNAASRHHRYGRDARDAVEKAREQVAALTGAEAGEIIFTSGATEAVNLALKGVMEAYASKGNHIITTAVEHKAVLDTCHYLEKKGVEVTILPVNAQGEPDPGELEAAIRPETVMVAVMYANNETGVLMPVREISSIARKHNLFYFCDATQAAGKIPVHVQEDGIDLLCLSAHKMYGPKGIGALYIRRKNPRVKPEPLIHGGGHEKGFRSGTLNVPGIAGLGEACALALQEMKGEAERLGKGRDRLEKALLKLEATRINGSNHRLPHVTNISFEHTEGDALMSALQQHLAVSSGSACSAATPEPSYVLRAMGLDDELAYSSIRFSLGRFTTEAEIDLAIEKLGETVTALRAQSPRWELFRHS